MESMASIFRFLPKDLFPLIKAELERVGTLSSEEILEEECKNYNSKQGDLEGYDCPLCQNRGYSSRVVGNGDCKC